jgi:serine phosphatase RsbU (regulator of sigma subunit)
MSIMSMHTLINQLQDNLAGSPDEFVAKVNRRLCQQSLTHQQEGFITLLYGVVEDGVLRWTSAGHCPPLLQDLETGEVRELGDARLDGGLPLAVSEDAEYETIVSPMPPGHRLIVYTDGIIEAMPGGGELQQFGVEGLKRTLHRCRRASLAETLDELFRDSQNFTAGQGRHDDTSVLLLERGLQ